MADYTHYSIATRHPVDGRSYHQFPSYEEAQAFKDNINEGNESVAQADSKRNFAWNYGWARHQPERTNR